MKETPLIKAVSNTGPMVLPRSPFFNGVLAVYASGFFGALGGFLWTALLGTGYATDLYTAILQGVVLAFIFTFFINLGILIAAFNGIKEEKKNRLQYIGGSLFGYISFSLILFLIDKPISHWLEPMGNVLAP